MCGIIGYLGKQPAGPILYAGLKKLEYRGYDSAGVASITGGFLQLKKEIGAIDDIEKKMSLSSISGYIGIGHSRWATHGGVTKENAHPHTCCKGEIAVVHNGIIENFQELKEQLYDHHFSSETDTEVLPHLIEEQNLPLEQAVPRALQKVKGSYALLIISTKEPEKIIAVRNESPLIIGLSDHGVFVASDVMPFLEHTNKAVYLDDGEMAVITKKDVAYYEIFSGTQMKKHPITITWSAAAAEKGENKYYMLKEIFEQPQTIIRVLDQDKIKYKKFVEKIRTARHLKFVACGTSRHATIIGRYFFNKIAGVQGDVYMASEFTYFADACDKETVIIAVSQSGETADVLDGLRKAKAKGAQILSLVNVVGSTIDRLSDTTLYLHCGPEIGVASTKAFTNQLALFYCIAQGMQGTEKDAALQLHDVSVLIEQNMPKYHKQMKEIAERIKKCDHTYFIARGANFPIALEGALKLKEISYIHAEGMPAGELKHGTLALIEQGTPVLLINPHDYTYFDSLSNGMETKARGAFLMGVSNQPNAAYDDYIPLPTLQNELLYPLLSVVPLQLLAYHTAVAKGLNPDKPRNLAKSVTVK